MPFRCRAKGCRKFCSAKTGMVMEGSQVGYQNWLLAALLVPASLQGVSSMKLHRDFGVTRKTAWLLAQRVRQALRRGEAPCAGPVAGDETSVGGKRQNRPQSQRAQLTGRGAGGQVAVGGAQDRASRQVAARVAPSTGKETLQGFVEDGAAPGSTVSTDDASASESLRFNHGTVRHSLQEYVRGDVHTNGIESLWSMLQRAHQGTFPKLSPQHLERYVQEFAGHHNLRERDTLDQLQVLCRGLEGQRLTYRALIRDNGRPSGARRVAGGGAGAGGARPAGCAPRRPGARAPEWGSGGSPRTAPRGDSAAARGLPVAPAEGRRRPGRAGGRARGAAHGRPAGSARCGGGGARRAPRLGGRISASRTRARKPLACWSSRAQHGVFRCGNRRLASDWHKMTSGVSLPSYIIPKIYTGPDSRDILL